MRAVHRPRRARRMRAKPAQVPVGVHLARWHLVRNKTIGDCPLSNADAKQHTSRRPRLSRRHSARSRRNGRPVSQSSSDRINKSSAMYAAAFAPAPATTAPAPARGRRGARGASSGYGGAEHAEAPRPVRPSLGRPGPTPPAAASSSLVFEQSGGSPRQGYYREYALDRR
jgi:hypothetical protein